MVPRPLHAETFLKWQPAHTNRSKLGQSTNEGFITLLTSDETIHITLKREREKCWYNIYIHDAKDADGI